MPRCSPRRTRAGDRRAVRRRRRPGRQESRSLCARPVPGRPRPARPRLLPLDRRQAGRGQGRLSGAYRQDADASRAKPMPRRAPRRSSISRPRSPRSAGRAIDSRDANKTYNKMTRRRARPRPRRASTSSTYFKGIGTPVDSVIVAQPSAITGIAKLVADAPIGVLQGPAAGPQSLDSYRRRAARARSTRSISPSTARAVGHARSSRSAGSARSTSPAARSTTRSASSMSRNISRPRPRRRPTSWSRTSSPRWTRGSTSSTWMAPETKVKAHAKLAAFTPKIGYPERSGSDYSALQIVAGDAFGNECARQPMGAATITSASSASRSSAGNGA